jgi:hypothetical protein
MTSNRLLRRHLFHLLDDIFWHNEVQTFQNLSQYVGDLKHPLQRTCRKFIVGVVHFAAYENDL